MSDLPWFKFDADAWLGGTISQLPLAGRGLFIHACALYWRGDCTLTVARVCLGHDGTLVERLLAELAEWGLLTVEGGHIGIPFLDDQRSEAEEHKRRLSEAGRRGGLASQARLKRGSSEAQAGLKPGLSEAQASKSKNKNKRERGTRVRAHDHPPPLTKILADHGCSTHPESVEEFTAALDGVDAGSFIPWAKKLLEREGLECRYARQVSPLIDRWREHIRFRAAVDRAS